jgi:hypothetical protein
MSKTEAQGTEQLRKRKPAGSPGTAHTPCVGTHLFVWSEAATVVRGIEPAAAARGSQSAAEKGPPEGLGCNCGMLELHYAPCACGCGFKSMSLGFTQRDLVRRAPRKPKSRKQPHQRT